MPTIWSWSRKHASSDREKHDGMLRSQTPSNWKREPLVWMIIAIPLSAVIMGVVMITLAIQSYSGLVVDDYYKKGKQINRVLARDKFAYELGLAAGFKLEADGSIEIRFAPEVQIIPGDKIVLELIHATMPGLDQKLIMRKAQRDPFAGWRNQPARQGPLEPVPANRGLAPDRLATVSATDYC